MTLEEFTGRTNLPKVPKTAKEVEDLISNLLHTKTYQCDGEFIQDVAAILAAIGEECLDSTKVIGQVGYAGSPLKPEWAYKEGQYPFHIKDSITGKNVPDPRVVYIGRMFNMFGEKVSGMGFEWMQELYKETGKLFHSFISPLDHAWDGIGYWNA